MAEFRTSSPGSEKSFDQLLRQCVQCGLCLPHCATWLATGNEVQSPRGRLVLLGLMEQDDGPERPPEVTDSFMQAFDRCIGCRACETACPSGVPFTLLEEGQRRASAWLGKRPTSRRQSVPSWVWRRMDRPGFLAEIARGAGLAKGMARALAGKNWRSRLAGGGMGRLVRLLGSLPESPRSDKELIRKLDSLCGHGRTNTLGLEPVMTSGPAVAFFSGCANAGLLNASSRRLRDFLLAAGCRLEEPPGQGCCGALAAHTGRPEREEFLKAGNRQSFAGALENKLPILTEAAGCGHYLKSYGDDFESGVTDATVFLANLDLPPLGKVPLRVAYHDPCHARHGQGIVLEPRSVLAAIPAVELVEPAEPEVCCGSGGAWGLRYPDMSEMLGLRKAGNLAATGADLIVTSNPGCLGQITDALAAEGRELPVLPLTDLLWYAACRGRQKGWD